MSTVAIYQLLVVARGVFCLLLDVGPGAAACGMGIDTLGTVASYQRHVVAGGGFFLLLDLGPGAAACGMGIEINTGYSRGGGGFSDLHWWSRKGKWLLP